MISTFRQTASGVIQGIRLYHRNHKYVVKVKVQHPGKPEENKNSKSRMASSQAVGRNASTQSEIFVSYGLLRRKGDSLDITIKKIRSMFVPQKNKQAPGRSWKWKIVYPQVNPSWDVPPTRMPVARFWARDTPPTNMASWWSLASMSCAWNQVCLSHLLHPPPPATTTTTTSPTTTQQGR